MKRLGEILEDMGLVQPPSASSRPFFDSLVQLHGPPLLGVLATANPRESDDNQHSDDPSAATAESGVVEAAKRR